MNIKKISNKGFTLVELLAVIFITGLVLSIGTYFIVTQVKKAKEEALKVSIQSIYKSADTYSKEFLSDTDWVKNEEDQSKEYACINVWWMINKGLQQKKDFGDNPNSMKEEYKIYNNAVVIITRNTGTKAIISRRIADSEEKTTCNNLLEANLDIIEKTTNSIKVKGNCTVKEITPDDIHYKYEITDNNENKTVSKVSNIKDSTYTFSNLKDGTPYNINLTCISNKYGDASTKKTERTEKLETPNITSQSNNVTVDFQNKEIIDSLTKTVTVDASNIIYTSNLTQSSLQKNTEFTINKGTAEFNISKSSSNNVTFTAKVSDGTNDERAIKTIPKINETVSAPTIKASDNKSSGEWHNKNFNLIITNNDTNATATIKYGTNENNLNNDYTDPVSVTTETKNTTYYARACIGNTCSSVVKYEAKLDKTRPNITFSMFKDNSKINNYSEDSASSSITWNNFNPTLKFAVTDNLSGVNKKAKVATAGNGSSETPNIANISFKEITLDTNYNYTISSVPSGFRLYSVKATDKAGNETTKNIYFKVDTEPPTVEFSFLNGNTKVTADGIYKITNGYIEEPTSWINYKPTLRFVITDSLSGYNYKVTYGYNYPGAATLDKDLKYNDIKNINLNSSAVLKEETISIDSNVYNRPIDSDGSRLFYVKLQDNAGNMQVWAVTFKIDTQYPVVSLSKIDNNNYTFECSTISGVNQIIANNNVVKVTENNKNTITYSGNNYEEPLYVKCISNTNMVKTNTYLFDKIDNCPNGYTKSGDKCQRAVNRRWDCVRQGVSEHVFRYSWTNPSPDHCGPSGYLFETIPANLTQKIYRCDNKNRENCINYWCEEKNNNCIEEEVIK